jgi:hypothetical protein
MGRHATALIALLAALPFTSACVTFKWEREMRDVAHANDAIDALHPGEATLSQCLEELGAPLYVWEYKRDGMALAWGWLDNDQKGFTVSVPVAEQLSASFRYDRIDARMRGVVLLFGEDLTLELAQRGYLRDLSLAYQRRRPADTSTPP